MKLTTLQERRQKLVLSYGKKCLKIEQTKDLFPKKEKEHKMQTGKGYIYEEVKTRTNRYHNSTVPYIQRILNSEEGIKRNPG